MNFNNMNCKYFILIIAILSNIASAYSQVTIGSNGTPVDGALLQLKEDENIGANAKKGLRLPRVNLTSIDNLYPMFSDDGASGYNEGIKVDEDKAHIGLIVYNVNKCLTKSVTNNGLDNGLQVWDGNQWVMLNRLIPSQPSNYKTYVDQQGNEFGARLFDGAGIWMIQNVRATAYADGTPLTASNKTGPTTYVYPGPSDCLNDSYFKYNERLGLLYTWKAATRRAIQPSLDEGQILGSSPGPNEVENRLPGGYQGICPNGWHIPSDREWNELEAAITTYASEYSTLTNSTWNANWDVAAGDRGDRGLSFIYPCGAVPNNPTILDNNYLNGYSDEFGFRVLLASMYGWGGNLDVLPTSQYGTEAVMWSSSFTTTINDTNYCYSRVFSPLKSGVLRGTVDELGLLSVRCKKNNNIL